MCHPCGTLTLAPDGGRGSARTAGPGGGVFPPGCVDHEEATTVGEFVKPDVPVVRSSLPASSEQPEVDTPQTHRSRSGMSNNFNDFLKKSKQRELKVKVPPGMAGKLRQAFEDMDQDGNGFLSPEELREALEVKMIAGNKQVVNEVLKQAMLRVDKDQDGVLDYQEFLEMALDPEPGFITRHKLALQGCLFLSFFAIAPIVYCHFNDDEGQWNVWEALYFAVVTVTTVGYGDYGPVNDGMMVFTIFYIIFGLGIIARIVDEAVTMVIQSYQEKMKQFNSKLASTATSGGVKRGRTNRLTRSITAMKLRLERVQQLLPGDLRDYELLTPVVQAKLWTSVALLALPIVVGTIFFALNEDWPWLHALYWSVVTCTTVGYGDLTLEKESSRIFSIFFILAGFAMIGAAVGNMGALRVEMAMERQKRELLGRSLSLDMIADMDRDGNGVDRCEFVCAMLVQLKKVSEDDLLPLLEKFDELDADRSGLLTREDLQILHQQRRLSASSQVDDSCTGYDKLLGGDVAQGDTKVPVARSAWQDGDSGTGSAGGWGGGGPKWQALDPASDGPPPATLVDVEPVESSASTVPACPAPTPPPPGPFAGTGGGM